MTTISSPASKKGTRYVLRDGHFVEGKAGPEQLPEHMRALPERWLTKDTSDGEHIHELDDPHIVQALSEDLAAAEEAGPQGPPLKDALQKFSVAQIGETVPLSASGVDAQWEIDVVKMRVMQQGIRTINARYLRGMEVDMPGPQYLWFPEDNVNIYELREGNPPPDSERPEYLRGRDLVLRYTEWPERLKSRLESVGVKLPDIGAAMVGKLKEVPDDRLPEDD